MLLTRFRHLTSQFVASCSRNIRPIVVGHIKLLTFCYFILFSIATAQVFAYFVSPEKKKVRTQIRIYRYRLILICASLEQNRQIDKSFIFGAF